MKFDEIRITYEATPARASMLTVSVPDIEKYGKAFLSIYNNVRENPGVLHKVINYEGTDEISLVCSLGAEKEARKFMSQFGEVIIEKCIVLNPVIIRSVKNDDMYLRLFDKSIDGGCDVIQVITEEF